MNEIIQQFVLYTAFWIIIMISFSGYCIMVGNIMNWFRNRRAAKKEKVDDLQRIQDELDELKKEIRK